MAEPKNIQIAQDHPAHISSGGIQSKTIESVLVENDANPLGSDQDLFRYVKNLNRAVSLMGKGDSTFSVIRDNVETLWQRQHDTNKKVQSLASSIKIINSEAEEEFVASDTAGGGGGGGGGTTTGSLVNVDYDEKEFTYTTGLLTQIVYKLATVTVLTLTLTYDSSNRPATVTDGTSTWTYTHAGTGFLTEVVKT